MSDKGCPHPWQDSTGAEAPCYDCVCSRLTAAEAERDALRERVKEWDDVFVPSRKQISEADALALALRGRVDGAEAALAASRAQVAKLLDALPYFGTHMQECSVRLTHPPECDCGFDDLCASTEPAMSARLVALERAAEALESISDGACDSRVGPGCDNKCRVIASVALAALAAAKEGR